MGKQKQVRLSDRRRRRGRGGCWPGQVCNPLPAKLFVIPPGVAQLFAHRLSLRARRQPHAAEQIKRRAGRLDNHARRGMETPAAGTRRELLPACAGVVQVQPVENIFRLRRL